MRAVEVLEAAAQAVVEKVRAGVAQVAADHCTVMFRTR